MAQNTKISWTDITWNMVWGCKGCYLGNKCYAKSIAKRFAKTIATKETNWFESYKGMSESENNYWIEEKAKELASFTPTYLHSQSMPKFPEKSKRIFANSMSDIAFWMPNWIKDLIYNSKKNSNHTFQLLTKFPIRLKELMETKKLEFPDNVWLGMTVTEQEHLEDYWQLRNIKAGKYFISFEPIQSEIDLNESYFPYRIIKHITYGSRTKIGDMIDWVIIGTESGINRKVIDNYLKVIIDLIKQAKKFNIPVFVKQVEIDGKLVKDNLPESFNYREFPI